MIKRISNFLVGLLVIGGVLAGAYWFLNDESVQLSDELKREAVGFHFKGGQGTTHFELTGPETAPVVVLVHGVSGPMQVWDKTAPALVAAGYRVLRYDLFGRGLSERVKGDYQSGLFDRQLYDLIVGLKLATPVTMVGSSMGAIVSSNFANQHPELVKRLVLIGPAGFPIEASPAAALMGVPVVGDYVMGTVGGRMLPTHHRKYFVNPDRFPEMQKAFDAQLKVAGTKRAILSTMRTMPVNDFSAGYEKVGRSHTPVLLLWGVADRTFPYYHHKKARQLMPQSVFISVPDAAHLPQYEMPELTNQAIINFLGQS